MWCVVVNDRWIAASDDAIGPTRESFFGTYLDTVYTGCCQLIEYIDCLLSSQSTQLLFRCFEQSGAVSCSVQFSWVVLL
jgi:hypothetical protein